VYYPLRIDTQRYSPEAKPAAWWNVLEGERTAVIGGAGAGKSTLLSYIAVQAARRLQRKDKSGKGEGPQLAEVHNQILPMVPAVFNLAAASIKLERAKLGDQQVLAEIEPNDWLPVLGLQIGLTGEQTRAFLETGEVLLLFDKLDEVPDPKDRETLLAGITKLQRRFAPLSSKNRVIIACRTSAWHALEGTSEFREFAIEPMDVSTRDAYLDNWCKAVWGDEADHVLKGLEHILSQSEAIGEIAANPQICRMLALVARDGSPPRQRAVLYERFIKRGFKAQPLLDFGDEFEILDHLTALAVELQQSTAGDSETTVSLSQSKVENLLGERLCGDKPWRVKRARGRALLNALVDHTGLLVVEGSAAERQVRFDHKTFQEYLAACHFAERDMEAIVEHASNPAWSETLALTAGVLARESERRLKCFLESLLGATSAQVDDPTEPTFADWIRRVAAASVCLRELASYPLKEETLAPARQAYDRIVPNLEKIEPQARFAIVEALGSVHDPRLEGETRWIELPDGWFVRGASSLDAWPQERPEMQVFVSRYRIQRWPVTIAEFQRFIRAGGYKEERWWDEEGWKWRQNGGKNGPLDWPHHRQKLNRPVAGVCFWETRAYCRWLGETGHPGVPNGWTIRLPTESEWERTARGDANGQQIPRRFPWGERWEDERANCLGSLGKAEIAPVGLFARGKSPVGAWDMAGNVAEHCLDGFAPYREENQHNPLIESYAYGHVVRGGAYNSPPLDLRVTYRFGEALDSQNPRIGFRCAAVPGEAGGDGDG
jgi:formylglycine-generating enzyme required for sulfatase activity